MNRRFRFMDAFMLDGSLRVWLLDESGGENHFFACEFIPKIHVFASVKELSRLKQVLDWFRIDAGFERKQTIKGFKTVLTVPTPLPSRSRIIKDIDRFGQFSYEIFNADMPIEELFMFSNDIFPTGEVEISVDDAGRIVRIVPQEQTTDEFEIPALKVVRLSIETSYSLRKDIHPTIVSIRLDDELFCLVRYKDQRSMITAFIDSFVKKDPDIILTDDGNVELPYLLRTIRMYYPGFSFSRFGEDDFKSKSGSYSSYGKTIFKQGSCYLKGRLHFQCKGTLYGAWDLDHPFTLARLCRCSLQRMNHRSAGYGVSNLQVYHAMKKGFMIPKRMSCVEVWKSGMELFNADRGSLIYEPVVGFHTDIAELDFVSLFPNIMVNHNISTEMLFCSCCRHNKVPGLDINICAKETGIIPLMLKPLIEKRLYYKSTGLPGHASRSDAIKGVLVTSFGYMGFRKSKFARIEAHQAIQAYARETLLLASKVAQERGFEVIHGIVDSLWVKKRGIGAQDVNGKEAARKELASLMHDIKAKTGFDIKLEGVYRWIVFLPSTQNKGVPVSTRFYGVFDTGELKLRGIEARTHDTPRFIARVQTAVIMDLAKARDFMEFKKLMRASVGRLDAEIDSIIKGRVDRNDLTITKGISKTKYDSRLAQGIILEKLKDRGFALNPGQYIRYVITDKRAKIGSNRYSLVEDWGGSEFGDQITSPLQELPAYLPGVPSTQPLDRTEYIRLLKSAVRNLFSPFGVDALEHRQATLTESFMRLAPRMETMS